MCFTRLAEIQDAKNRQKFAIYAPSHNFLGLSQLRHVSTVGESLLNSNISFTCSHNMVNFGPLAAEIGLPVWGTQANFNGFRVLASLLHRRRSTEVNQTFHDVWPSPGLLHYIYINTFTCKIHCPSKSCVLLYLQRYCTALE